MMFLLGSASPTKLLSYFHSWDKYWSIGDSCYGCQYHNKLLVVIIEEASKHQDHSQVAVAARNCCCCLLLQYSPMRVADWRVWVAAESAIPTQMRLIVGLILRQQLVGAVSSVVLPPSSPNMSDYANIAQGATDALPSSVSTHPIRNFCSGLICFSTEWLEWTATDCSVAAGVFVSRPAHCCILVLLEQSSTNSFASGSSVSNNHGNRQHSCCFRSSVYDFQFWKTTINACSVSIIRKGSNENSGLNAKFGWNREKSGEVGRRARSKVGQVDYGEIKRRLEADHWLVVCRLNWL